MDERVVIPRRFNGPPESANGGYTCGVVSELLGAEAEVTLRSPPPLDTPLEVRRDGDRIALWDSRAAQGPPLQDGVLVAEGEPVDLELDVPEPPSLEEADLAVKSYAGFRHHAYSTCFTCGPDRSDGLSIFPGPVPGREVVATPWLPPPGELDPKVVWAALDSPAGWAVDDFQREGILLGRLAAKIIAPVRPAEPHVVVGWPIGIDGRKRYAGSAVFTADGELLAFSRSTWIQLRSG